MAAGVAVFPLAPDLVASLGLAAGVAVGLAVEVGVKVGVASTVGWGVGLGVGEAVYLPRSQTKYAARRTMIRIITTIVTFLLI